MKTYDLVIRGGTIVDGSGGPAFTGDVALQDGWIVAVGVVEGEGKTEIDAAGRIVTPGFVDIHTHYDGQAIWSERLSPSSDHGVTTVMTGNCGIGFAPCRKKDHEALIELMEGVEDIPEAVTGAGLTWEWESFPEYLDAVEKRPHDIDMVTLIPHSPLRVYVMGERALRREHATAEDLEKMKQLYAEALDAGAIGIGTSRLPNHRSSKGEIIPSWGAEEREFDAFGEVMKEKGRGLFQMINTLRDDAFEDEIGLMSRLSQRSGRPLTYSQSQNLRWRDVGSLIHAANENGANIKAQLFPRPVGMIVGLNSSLNPFSLGPSWAALADLPLEQKVAEMRKPEVRERLLNEEPANILLPNNKIARYFDRMFELEGDIPNYEPDKSQSISMRAKALGVRPAELAYDLLLKNEGSTSLLVAMGNYNDFNLDFVAQMIDDPNIVLGLGDGGAHYGMICDGSYPTFVLTHWVRDRKGERITLENAVYYLARKPALAIGLEDRGLLQPGHRAHVNVIDLENLSLGMPRTLSDLPGGGRRLHQSANGYVATIVNGEIMQRNGVPTGVSAGKLLRGVQKAHNENQSIAAE